MPKHFKNHCQNKYRNISWTSLKIMFFWMVKSFKFIVKATVFEGFAGCVCERKGILKTHQQWKQHPFKNRYKTDVETMLKKVMPKWWNAVRKWIPKGSQNEKNMTRIYSQINAKIRHQMWTHVVTTGQKCGGGGGLLAQTIPNRQ